MEAILWLVLGMLSGLLIGYSHLFNIIIRFLMDNFNCDKDMANEMLYEILRVYK